MKGKYSTAKWKGMVFIMLWMLSFGVFAQSITIHGTVVDDTGEPVIGATIALQNNPTVGTVTDINGEYTLANVPADATLVFSYVGMLTQTVPVNSRTTINLVMVSDSEMLEELVVVGYTVQRRESLTGALTSISSDRLRTVTTPSVENMLSSRAPGVFVAPGSGQPGAAGAVVIRGKSTVSGSTAPLWVINGVIVGNNAGNLNPNDIESITILKDAASTAIYGSQGANGVIVVTTRAPRADRLQVSLSARTGVTTLNNGNLQMMNGAELYDYFQSFANSSTITFPRWNEDLRNANFNWWDYATQTGVAQDYSVSISGGSEQLRSMISLGYYDETGAVIGYNFKRYSLLYRSDFRPTQWLTVRPTIQASRRDIDDRQRSTTSMYSNLPWDSPYDKNGNLVPNRPGGNVWVNGNSNNYLFDLQWNFTKSTNYEFMGNFDFDIKLTDWLTFASVNSFRWIGLSRKSYTDPRSSGGASVKGRIEEYRFESQRRFTNQMLRFNKFWDRHSINGLLAYEFNDSSTKTLTARGTGFVSGYEVLDVTAIPEFTRGGIEEFAVQSVFANANYSYDGKYLAQVSVRRDGASNFGANARYGNFGSISGAWNVHREDFFNFDKINELKLRASYGSVGNRPNSLYPSYHLYALSSSTSYNTNPGALISQVGNRDMTWEKSLTTGIGLDLVALERVRLTLDYYVKNTSDLLYQVPVPSVTGVTSVWRNVGEVLNKGFEGSLSIDVVKTRDLLWTVDANIGLNRNKVTKLYGVRDANGNVPPIISASGLNIAGSGNRILREGIDMDTWFLREWAGVNPETGAPQWYRTAADGTREITETYAQANEVELGAYTPDFFGGFSTSLLWKNFDMNAVFGFSVGGKILNYSRLEYDSDGAYTDRNQMKLQNGWSRWEKPGDIATHPVARFGNTQRGNLISSRFLEDGSYFKMRSLQLGYNFDTAKYNLSNLRLFVSGENLFTITNYSGVDPEIPQTENAVIGVTSPSVYPSRRVYSIGVNLTF